jgi:hypothetical protein
MLEALRDRLTLRSAVSWLAVIVGFHVFFDASLPQLATTAAVSGLAGVSEAAVEAYDLRESVGHAGVGAASAFSAAMLFAFDDGSIAVPAALLLGGGWVVFDAIQTVRHEGATVPETTRDGHEVYREYVGRRVHEALKERPRTRRELKADLDVDDESLDAAVDRLRDRDVIERSGSEFDVAPTPERNAVGHAFDAVGGVARRIARPVTLEFADEGPSRGRGAPVARGRAGDRDDALGRETAADSDESPDDADGTGGGERERERELE